MTGVNVKEKIPVPFTSNLLQNNRYHLMNGLALEEIKKVEDNSIDLICIDPPYNLAGYSTGNMNFSWRKTINNDLAEWDLEHFFPEKYLSEFRRVLSDRGNIFAFCSYNLLGDWHRFFDPEFDTFQFVIWHKTNPAPKIRKAGFLNSCEIIVCMWNKGHIWNFTKQSEMHNFIETPICMGNERIKDPHHPTQKPLRVLNKIIEWATEPDSIVLDCFMGVNSTGHAAIENGRRFIGIEYDKNYFDAANKRISEVCEQWLSRPA